MSKFKTFYGFRFYLERKLSLGEYAKHRPHLRKAVGDEIAQLPSQFRDGVYIAHMKFEVTKRVLWGFGPLHERVRDFRCHFRVNPQERTKNHIRFLNKQLPSSLWLLTPNMEVSPGEFDIRCWVSNSWFGTSVSDTYSAEMLLITAVHNDVSHRKRKLKVVATVRPTTAFAKRFYTSNEASKEIVSSYDYFLDQEVQLSIYDQ